MSRTARLGRRSSSRMTGFLLASTVAVTALALPASATVPGEVQGSIPGGIQTSPDSLQFVFTSADLAADVALDPATVEVEFGGESLDSSATAVTEDSSQPVRIAVLAMDISGSMQTDDRIGASRTAATAFLQSVPEDVQVGLVTFGDLAQTEVAPTLDRAAVQTAVNALEATDDFTALYDGVVTAVGAAGSQGLRQVLLLTDGQNDAPGSTTTLPVATSAVASSGVQLNAVALSGSDSVVLQQLATAGGGQVYPAVDPTTSEQFFAEQAAAISRQLEITATVPARLAGTQGLLDVRVTASDGQVVTYREQLTTAAAPTPTPTPSPTPTSTEPPPLAGAPGPGLFDRTAGVWFVLGLVALFGGLLVLLALAFSTVPVGRSNQVQLKRRLAFYSLSGGQPVKESESAGLADTQVARSVVGLAGRIMQRRDFETVLAQRMESAGVPLKPAEWLLLHVGIGVLLALVLLVLSGGRLIPMLIGLAAGLIGPWMYLRIKEGRRHRAFQAQMPDSLQLIAGSLSAGYSLPQAIDTVVREGQDPIASELNRALVETRLGVPLEDALEGVAARMSSPDFHWVVMALRIQRDVGGNLAEVLSTVAGTMRERARLERQIQVLSAEGRLSAWILAGLPVAFIVYLLLVRPEYLEPLYTTPLGIAMIVLSSVLILIGGFWLSRTVKVRV